MGSIEFSLRHPFSHRSSPSSYSSAEYSTEYNRLHRLVRPDRYPTGYHRPSLYSAYARAAKRYNFGPSRYAGFAKLGHVVVKVRGTHYKEIDHEVPAESIQNGYSEYVVQVKVGTPGVILNLDFDTGSSDLWIWSSEIAHASRYPGHTIFNPHKSKTAKRAHGTWNISYGDGSSASGDVYTDVITVAGVTIPHQSIELASKLSSSFLQDGGNDGLLGLAWPSINTVEPNPVKTPVQNMIDHGLIDQPVFTVKLSRGDEPGFYSFGFIDTNVTSHTIRYTPVDNSQGLWQVPSPAYGINGRQRARHYNTAILDTGTTLCLVADDVVEAIYDEIDGATYDDRQGGFKYPSDASIPDVSFAVGDRLYFINAEDFGLGPAGGGYTFGGIQSRGDLDFDIFGDVFLKSVYVVFNQGEKTVGLAQRND